jgi:hypothetical protein
MIRLQRGLPRSDAALTGAGAGAGRDGSAFGLIFGVAFAAAADGGATSGCVESGVGALAAMPAAGRGGAGSDLGTVAGEACESTAAFSDGDGVTACFGAGGETVGSILA